MAKCRIEAAILLLNIGLAACRMRVKIGGGMLDDKIFNGGIWNKHTLAVAGVAILTGRMRDSFEIDGGMQKKNYECHAENCQPSQAGLG